MWRLRRGVSLTGGDVVGGDVVRVDALARGRGTRAWGRAGGLFGTHTGVAARFGGG